MSLRENLSHPLDWSHIQYTIFCNSKLELHEFQIKDAFGKVVRGGGGGVVVVIIATAPGHYLEMK
jgi:hypothetical protein